MKLSKHSKLRIKERTDLNHQERRNLFRQVLSKGKSIQDVKNEKIAQYMLSKSKKCKVKLYDNYLFIYSKNNKILYTMYKLPEELLVEDKNGR